MRDELTFYLCFFIQAYSVRDWLVKQGVMSQSDIDLAIQSDERMCLCRDICNRYKHLIITKPSLDADWEITRRVINPFADDNEWEWTVRAARKTTPLWDLMVECIGFWEALVAAYGLDAGLE